MDSKQTAEKIGELVGMILAIATFLFLGAFIAQSLWNWLVPEIFNGPEVTYWQAMGVMFLVRLIGGINLNYKK